MGDQPNGGGGGSGTAAAGGSGGGTTARLSIVGNEFIRVSKLFFSVSQTVPSARGH